MNDLIERYLQIWNTTEAGERRQAIEQVWSGQATYTDPLVSATGHEEIDAVIAAVQAQFPGYEFRLAGPVDAHHDQARFGWELAQPGAEALVVGFDVATRDADGRIDTVLGFLDRVPG